MAIVLSKFKIKQLFCTISLIQSQITLRKIPRGIKPESMTSPTDIATVLILSLKRYIDHNILCLKMNSG